jgi:hypothetical protein
MSDENNPMLPDNFVGEWKVLRQATPTEPTDLRNEAPLATVNIRSQTHGYEVEYFRDTDTDPLTREEAVYDPFTGTLLDIKNRFNIAYWRKSSSVEIIFSYAKGVLAWNAIRTAKLAPPLWAADGSPSSRVADDGPPVKQVCRTWTITTSQGKWAPKQTRKVRIRELGSYWEDSWESSDLLGLFLVDSKGPGLYDILSWDEDVKSFNSIFGLRSLNYWPGLDPNTPEDDSIFATYDFPDICQLLPQKLGQLLPFERPEDSPSEDEDDPDTGVWVGEPG